MDAVLVYAFTLGIVAAVNPCGFPLLPAYLASFTLGAAADLTPSRHARSAGRAVIAGLSVTAAFVATFGAVGIVVAAGTEAIIAWVPWLMVLVGAGLVVVGLSELTGRWHGPRLPSVPFRSGRGILAMAGFGVAYAVGSLTCALPLFLAGVGAAFTSGGWAAGVSAFVAYAVGMGLFVTAAGVATAMLGSSAVRRFRAVSRWVPIIGGVLVTLVGAYLMYYWIGQLVAPAATSAPIRWVDTVQSAVSDALAQSPLVSAAVLGTIVIAAMLVAGSLVHRGGVAGRATRFDE